VRRLESLGCAESTSIRRDADPVVACSYNVVMSGATSSVHVTVGVRELKNQLSRYLDRVKAGEEITVTEHGRPVARLTSIAPDIDRMAALVAAGIVRPATAGRRLPTTRVQLTDGDSIAEVVARQRR
jgi:prevent-host-death family protein